MSESGISNMFGMSFRTKAAFADGEIVHAAQGHVLRYVAATRSWKDATPQRLKP